MDVKFLKRVQESYITKNILHNKIQEDEIFTDLYEKLKDLRESDLEIYDKICDTGRIEQLGMLENYLDCIYKDEDIIGESAIIGAALVGALISVGYLHSENISTNAVKGIHTVATWFESMAKSILKGTTDVKFRYAIIQRNHTSCYKRCGITDPTKDVNLGAYISVKTKKPKDFKSIKQAQCLTKCYIEFISDSIALLSRNYLACLNKTGAGKDFKTVKSDTILHTLTKLNLSVSCHEYYKHLKDALDKFDDLMDFLFDDDEAQKVKYSNMLKSKIYKTKQNVFKRK